MLKKKFKLSDHYDGKVFFNPTLPKNGLPGFLKALYMFYKTPMAIWPAYVQNQAKPQLDKLLNSHEVAITFVNHATFLIQFSGFTILTDPVWSKRVSPFSSVGPKRVREPGINFSDLPKIDLILISHNHYDHLDLETLKKLREKGDSKVIVALGDKALVQKVGFTDVTELDWWDTVNLGEIDITFAPTQHFSSRSLFDKCKSLWGSFVIKHQQASLYFGGDAGYSSHYQEIAKRLGPIDLALIGIGAYQPQWFMKPVHMSPEEAVKAHLDLQAKQSIGMHFGTFKLSAEAIDKPVEDLNLALQKYKLSTDDFFILDQGQTGFFDFA